jgi:hypothetical protein
VAVGSFTCQPRTVEPGIAASMLISVATACRHALAAALASCVMNRGVKTFTVQAAGLARQHARSALTAGSLNEAVSLEHS